MKKNILHKGFTLVETLASISILAIVVIGPLSAIVSSSGYARLAKDTMTATYLAEGAVELLQNQYDSMYVYCRKNLTATDVGGLCEPQTIGATEVLETTGETSWRLFKNRLTASSENPSCYTSSQGTDGTYATNAAGCAFDSLSLLASSTEKLVRYAGDSNYCKELVPVATTTKRTVFIKGSGGQEDFEVGGFVYATSTTYVCNGRSLTNIGTKVLSNAKPFKRTVSIEQVSTFEAGASSSAQYSDDLRLTSNVEFKSYNGSTKNIKIVRFMHARP